MILACGDAVPMFMPDRSPAHIEGGRTMATYVILGSFTEQGIRNVKDTMKRAEAVKKMAKKADVDMREVFWTLGAYDIVCICEAPDEQAITALGLSIGALGNARTQTLRAFTAADMKGILGKMV
jgi:uncharacterized protein with GYD domain